MPFHLSCSTICQLPYPENSLFEVHVSGGKARRKGYRSSEVNRGQEGRLENTRPGFAIPGSSAVFAGVFAEELIILYRFIHSIYSVFVPENRALEPFLELRFDLSLPADYSISFVFADISARAF
jgi:hypothetical protein